MIRPKDEEERDFSPFDDEGKSNGEGEDELELDAMSISNFSKRYLSQSGCSPEHGTTSGVKLHRKEASRTANVSQLAQLHELTQRAYLHATGNDGHLDYSPVTAGPLP